MAFVSSFCPSLRAPAPRSVSRLRRTAVRAAATPPLPPADGATNDGSDWLDMARGLGGGEGEARSDPTWVFPEGEDLGGGAWAAWDAAKDREVEGEKGERDPKAETDFWRGAAREVAGVDEEFVPSSDPKVLWGEATKVTASVADMQESLRDEIEGFDPLEGSDAYREIARELVGPGSGVDGGSDSEADGVFDRHDEEISGSAGTGWNPDVDWKRFDDVNRDLETRAQKEMREGVRDTAEKEWKGVEDTSSALEGEAIDSYTDADGNVMSAEEVRLAIAGGAVIVDENGNEVQGQMTSGKVSGSPEPAPSSSSTSTAPVSASPESFFTGNMQSGEGVGMRKASGRTYGPDSLSEEEEVDWLREKGLKRRDPEDEKKFWMDAAREVGIAPEEEEEVSERIFEVEAENVAPNTDDEPQLVLRRDSPVSLEPEEDDADVDSSSAWSAWKEGSSSWAKDVEAAPPRDAKAEVDMWRGAAKAVVPGADQRDVKVDASSPPTGAPSSASAWESWNSASASWKSDFETADAAGGDATEQSTVDYWRQTAKSVGGEWGSFDSVPHGDAGSNSSFGGAGAKTWGSDWGGAGGESKAWSSWQNEGSNSSFGGAETKTWGSDWGGAGGESKAWSSWQNEAKSTEATGFGASSWNVKGSANRSSGADERSNPSMWASVARGLSGGDDVVEEAVEEAVDKAETGKVVSNVDRWKDAARDFGGASSDSDK